MFCENLKVSRGRKLNSILSARKSKMAVRIPVYGLTWHIHQSPALYELLVSPLSPYIQFEQLGWDGEGELPDFQAARLRNNPIIFFQLAPPESIYNDSDLRIVWIPMWDQARGYDLDWWS